MVVYGDLLFLINFSMDFLCFYFLCLLLHKRLPVLRVCVASALGGAYSVASLFINSGAHLRFALDVSVPVLMCIIAFASRKSRARDIAKSVLIYFFVSALLGGVMTALFYFINQSDIPAGEIADDDGIDVWIFAFLTLISSIFTLKGGGFFRSSHARREGELSVFEDGNNRSVKLRALVDSGNLVREPLSERAVVFASLDACSSLLDKSLVDALMQRRELESLPFSIMSRIRLIAHRTLTGEAVMPAVRFKRVVFKGEKCFKELDVYIAFVSKEVLGEYDAIISHEAII